jgi:hypothetical protein
VDHYAEIRAMTGITGSGKYRGRRGREDQCLVPSVDRTYDAHTHLLLGRAVLWIASVDFFDLIQDIFVMQFAWQRDHGANIRV